MKAVAVRKVFGQLMFISSYLTVFSFSQNALSQEKFQTRLHDGDSIPAERTKILNEIPGFAKDTRGGQKGVIKVVKNLNGSGEGSLKEALESKDPLWIVFERGLNGTIYFDGKIHAKSFKTVDGRGNDITLKIKNKRYWKGGITIGNSNGEPVENVIILNLSFDGSFEKYKEDAEGADGIHIRNRVKKIWIHKCSFTNWSDGAIDIKYDEGFERPQDITISSNYFTKTFQPMALAARDLSVVRNYCKDIGKRCIQLNIYGRGHFANNVVEDWTSGEILAAKDGAHLYVDNNIYAPSSKFNRAGAALKKDTNDRGRWEGNNNYSWKRKVNFRNESKISRHFKKKARQAFKPIVCSSRNCWKDLHRRIITGAGRSNY